MGQIRTHLEQSQDTKSLLIGYWSKVDTLSHYHGWDSPQTAEELTRVLTTVQSELFEQLDPAAVEGTVVLMLADHGQTIIPHSRHIYLEAHPELHRMLLMRPAGELRVPYLYARQGARDDVLAYLMRIWPMRLSRFLRKKP
ncbi:MAG: alkaline phosphatase family protein [Chloroflexota bacterium]